MPSSQALNFSIATVKRSNIIFGRTCGEMDTIGARLRYLRELLGLTQRQVAEKLGVSPQAVTAWERNNSDISRASLVNYWKLTGCDLHWLLTGEGLRTEFINVGGKSSFGLHPDNRNIGRFIPMLEVSEIVRLKKESIEEIVSKRVEGLILHKTQFPCGPDSIWHEIKNNANAPRFSVGDRVAIDPDEEPAPGDFILAADDDTDIVYFGEYLQLGPKKDFKINFLNHRHAPILSTENHLSLIGVMTEHAIPRRPQA